MTFDATYTFTAKATGASGTIRVVQRPPEFRVDFTAGGSTAQFFDLPSGVVSCTRKEKVSCFLVARPGEPVPALFDPGVDDLFRDAVRDLATRPEAYDVTVAPNPTGAAALPAATCFHLVRRVTSPPPSEGFESGDYCFTESGIPYAFRVASGEMTLQSLGTAPDDAAFTPPAPAASLPPLSPSPSG